MNSINKKLPFILETIGESPKQPPVIREDGYEYHHIIWVKNGEGKFESEDKTYYLTKGEGMFMRRLVPHYYYPEGGIFHTAWCTFSTDEGLLNYSIGEKKYLTFSMPEHLELEFRMLQNTAKSNATPFRISAAGYSFVTDFFEYVTKTSDDIIANVRQYLENNCNHPITLDDVANVSGLDKYALCRYFKKHNKRSVMEELLSIRINKAKRLLRYTSENVETICFMCGFESPSYFSLRFREKCGCSPSEYRSKRR